MGTRFLRYYVVGVFVLLLLPLVLVIPFSFTSGRYLTVPPPGWSLQWYRSFFESPIWQDALIESVRIAAVSMLISTVIGTSASFPLTRAQFRGRRSLQFLLLSPLVVPEIAIAIGIYFVALRTGINDRWWTVALGHSVLSTPIVITIMTSALRGFDRDLEFAALSLGAKPIKALGQITLRLNSPAIATSAIFSFMWSFANLLISLFLGGSNVITLPLRIWSYLRTYLDLTMLAISVMLLILTLLVVTVSMRLRTLTS